MFLRIDWDGSSAGFEHPITVRIDAGAGIEVGIVQGIRKAARWSLFGVQRSHGVQFNLAQA
jgi:hypothetical protein